MIDNNLDSSNFPKLINTLKQFEDIKSVDSYEINNRKYIEVEHWQISACNTYKFAEELAELFITKSLQSGDITGYETTISI